MRFRWVAEFDGHSFFNSSVYFSIHYRGMEGILKVF